MKKLNKTQQFSLDVENLVNKHVDNLTLNISLPELYEKVAKLKETVQKIKNVKTEDIIMISIIKNYTMTNKRLCEVDSNIQKFYKNFKYLNYSTRDFIGRDIENLIAEKFYKDNPDAKSMDKELKSILQLLKIQDTDVEELLNIKYAKFVEKYGDITLSYRTPVEKLVYDELMMRLMEFENW